MWEMLTELTTSKKFMASFGAVVAVFAMNVAAKAGFVLDKATADEISKFICMSVSTYVVAQGLADHGKEAAKIKAQAEKPPVVTFTSKGNSILLEDKPKQ